MRWLVIFLFVFGLSVAACGADKSADDSSDSNGDLEGDTDSDSDTGNDSDLDTGTELPTISDCNDGIDNDSDGYTDWQFDLGCVHADDDETSGSRAEEQGFTTFDVSADSRVIYVSASDGVDTNDGLTPETPVQTIAQGASLLRDGENDFMLLKRGDVWRGESLGRFISGRDAAHPMVIASYGDSVALPRVEVNTNFIDHNGQERSYVSIVGLEIVAYPKIVGDAEYDGSTGGGFRYVGGGSDLLIEGCRLTHCELVVQSYDVGHYENVEVRRNVVELNYHVDTCGQNSTYRPSGIYTSHVDGMLIEGNIFDHNGWNEEVESACATMYNHNMYLSGNDNLVVRENIIARASSMGIKMRSDETGDSNTLLFENNLFVDGEIGLGIGGNTEEPHRFSDVTIENNVFTQIGLNNPTERNFAWMLDMSDIDTALVTGNYFLHQPWYGNAYGIALGGGTQTDISIVDNLFYNLMARSLRVQAVSAWENVQIRENRFVDPGLDTCLVDHSGGFASFSYADNEYSGQQGVDWFCGDIDGDLNAWNLASSETGAAEFTPAFRDPDRTVGSYAATLGLDGTLEAFMAEAVERTRLNWNDAYTATALNNYIREGFE
ncbi:MAG: right-handed parallel beta-helix repeat-containing protein [Deltaproteobacteria bacterium]|nr:right-handed parallel beta-helix repeat-containing protein [Deltaproteobacteria bacterium]MBN2672444.1 right-handed parallel beta-helix repeat-containing protein [Deltaproteobacteria bacterium]